MRTKKNPSLSDLQRWMRWTLTHPSGVSQALHEPHALHTCLRVIGETPEVDRATRLAIYGNGYYWRIIDVLGNTFSSVKNVVGADAFNEMARAYVTRHPSTFRSIDDVGHEMEAFLRTHTLSRKFPFLSDVAALDWASHRSFFADDLPLLDLNNLKTIAADRWPNAHFTLDPSVRLLKLQWPIDALWRDDGKWTARQLARLKKQSINVMMFRLPEKIVRAPRITDAQYQLLNYFLHGATLETALSRLPAKAAKTIDSESLRGWFQSWVQNGVIRHIHISPR